MASFLRKDANQNDLAEKFVGGDSDRNGIPDRADALLGTGANSGMQGQILGAAVRSKLQGAGLTTGAPVAGAGLGAGTGAPGGMGQGIGQVLNALGGGGQGQVQNQAGVAAAPATGGATSGLAGGNISQMLHDVANRGV